MNGGLNVSTVEMRPPPWWGPLDSSVELDCSCAPRARSQTKRYVAPGDTVRIYTGGDATAVVAADPFTVAPGGWADQITPDDVQLRTFVSQGNSFLYILNGRDGQQFYPPFVTTTPTGDVSSILDLEIRK